MDDDIVKILLKLPSEMSMEVLDHCSYELVDELLSYMPLYVSTSFKSYRWYRLKQHMNTKIQNIPKPFEWDPDEVIPGVLVTIDLKPYLIQYDRGKHSCSHSVPTFYCSRHHSYTLCIESNKWIHNISGPCLCEEQRRRDFYLKWGYCIISSMAAGLLVILTTQKYKKW